MGFHSSKETVKKEKSPMAEVTGHLLSSGTGAMEPWVIPIQCVNDASEPGIPLGFLTLDAVCWSEQVHTQQTGGSSHSSMNALFCAEPSARP